MAEYEKLEEEIRRLKHEMMTENIPKIFCVGDEYKRCVSPVDSVPCSPEGGAVKKGKEGFEELPALRPLKNSIKPQINPWEPDR